MKKLSFALILALLVAIFGGVGAPRPAFAQFNAPYVVSSNPGTCTIGHLSYQTSGTVGLYLCTAANTWTLLAVAGSASNTMPTAGAIGALPYFNATTGFSTIAAVAIGQVLASKGTGTAPAWVTYALTHSNPANQTGNATATFKMNGLACAITPTATGRVVFTITGQAVQNTTADGVTYKLAEGTGGAPSNAGAAAGTVISATQTWTALTGVLTVPFSITASVTGLALSTAVWFDLQVAEVTGGTASITNVDCTAHEI